MSDVAAGPGVALARIVDALGAGVEVHLPPGPDPVVTAARLYDQADVAALRPGDAVLGVNVAGDAVEALVVDSRAAGAAAVVVRGPLPVAPDDLAVLVLPPEFSWDAALRVISALVGAAATEQDDAPVRDLFALANALAALVGGAITIEDARSTLLAYSTLDQPIDEARRRTILGRSHGEDWADRIRDAGVLRPLMAESGVVLRVVDPVGEARPRLAGSVGAGGELLGFVWAVEGDRPFSAADEDALRRSLPLVALHVLRHRAIGSPTRRRRGAALRDALTASAVPLTLADELGMDGDAPCTVVAFRILVDEGVEQAVTRTKLADLVTTVAEAYRRPAVCAWIDSTVYALLPGDDGRRLVPLAQGIVQQAATALPAVLFAGVGSTVPRLVDLQVSRAEADRVVRVLQDDETQRPRAAHLDDVRIGATLVALQDLAQDRPELRLPAVMQLEQTHPELEQTLRTFVRCGGDATATARALALHANTIRYRLSRVQELTALDLSAPDVLFVVALHFRALPT